MLNLGGRSYGILRKIADETRKRTWSTMVILFEADSSFLFVTHIQKTTHKSTADDKVVNLIDRMLSFNSRAQWSDSLPPMKRWKLQKSTRFPLLSLRSPWPRIAVPCSGKMSSERWHSDQLSQSQFHPYEAYPRLRAIVENIQIETLNWRIAIYHCDVP